MACIEFFAKLDPRYVHYGKDREVLASLGIDAYFQVPS